jgi:putative ABC transport system permease protein
MPARARIASLWRTLFRRAALDRELDDELGATFELLVEREIAAGRTPEAARRAARAALGGPGGLAAVRADVRDQRVGHGLDTLLLDARQGWRGLRHAPRLTALIVATLAVGIGSTAAIFSIVRALLIEPLPYAQPDRLVFVWLDGTRAGYPRGPMSGPDLHDLRAGSRTIAAFGAIWATGTIALAGGGQDPEQLRSAYVTTNFFDLLGSTSALGRTFRPQDSAPGAHPTILLGWDLFTRRFGGDAAIVGREILVDERPTTVIGVMPPAFRLLLPPDSSVPDRLQAWQPFWPELETGPRGNLFLRVVGRMRPGVDVAQAAADLDAVAAEITRAKGARRRFTTVGLQAEAVRDLRGPVLVLFAGVALLLTIAGVNVAGLLVARAASRRHEIALRLALGAGLIRLLRQALVEGLALTGLGAAGGLAVGYAGLHALLALAPEPLARIRGSRLDAPVVAFTLAVGLAWGLLFTLAPLGELLRAGADLRGRLQGRTLIGDARYRARAALVVLQVGLSVVLLVGAGLLVRTFIAVQHVDPGFDAANRLTLKIALPESRYQDAAALATADRELRRRLAAIPGVRGAAAISHLPYDTLPNWALRFAPDGTTSRDGEGQGSADTRTVTPGLLETLGVQVVEGRTFTEDDGPPVPRVVIDDMLARRLWPGQSAVGRTFLIGQAVPDRRVTVVGVVRHLRQRSLVEDLTPQIFLPYRLWQRSPMAYVVHADRDPATLAVDARAAVAAVDPRLPLADVRPLAAFVDAARATRRFTMQLAAAFAAAALALTCLGVYGVLAYAVEVRQRDIGVRRALGADTRQVVGEVLREGLGLALAGAAGGLAVAAVSATLLRGLLYGVEPRDPVSFGVGVALVVAGAVLACAVPAWRAAAISPMEALRGE